MRRPLLLAAVLAAAALGAVSVPGVALAATPATGTVSVQSAAADGSTVAATKGNVNLIEADGTPVAAGETDASGHITFSDVPAGSGYEVDIAFHIGAPRLNGSTSGVSVAAGQTTAVRVAVPLGGSIGGVLTSPVGDISGTEVVSDNLTTGAVRSLFVGDGNTYLAQGLTTGLYRFSSFSGGGTEPFEWLEDVQQQTATHAATFESHDDHYVHSDYDLEVTLAPPAAGEAAPSTWNGTTVRVISASTGAVFSEIADSSSSATKLTQYEVSSGNYTVEILPPGGGAPLWYAGPGAAFATNLAAAVRVAVTFGQVGRITGH